MSIKSIFTGTLRRIGLNFKLSNQIHTSGVVLRGEDRKEMLASMPQKDSGTAGEQSLDIDTLLSSRRDKFFPKASSARSLFGGIAYNELPVCNIRVSPNNTIISFTDYKGVPRLIRSCGIEGFKNTRKGTNIAAQATAITIGSKAVELGWQTVRVKVRGLGPGRMSAIKGLQMSGLNIVSITDNTPVSKHPPRPRKQRSL